MKKTYTFMFLPRKNSEVKKWVVSKRAFWWGALSLCMLCLVGLAAMLISLRYLAQFGEFKQAQLRNQYLESKVQALSNKMTSSESTLLRVQNFEQKLRVLANIDNPDAKRGIGPLSDKEEEIFAGQGAKDTVDTLLAANDVSPEFGYRMRSMELGIEGVQKKAYLQEQSLQQLYELLRDQRSVLTATPSIWPTDGWMTSKFGFRISPFTGERKPHHGIDIAAPIGTKVVAPADGIVFRSGGESGYGKLIELNHGYGIMTRFAHNSKLLVKSGEKVARGQTIALVGNTGHSTAPHLHYEVRINGEPVDPLRYILE